MDVLGVIVNFIFCSCGNDSVALIQWMLENKPFEQNVVVYSDTGWAAPLWSDRVRRVEQWVNDIGFSFVVTESVGMERLVREHPGWPGCGIGQFCTEELKVRPARELMTKLDPDLNGECFTGIRREESQNRKNAPAFIEGSERHGGRDLHSPLVAYTESGRDELLNRAGFEPLPHGSMECFPCVCSNREDLKKLAGWPSRIQQIENIEKDIGYTSKGKPRVMFNPKNKMGALGIREVIDWAMTNKGKFQKIPDGQLSFMPCTSGFCRM